MKQVIVLVGPKGAGKTTIGALLADTLGIHFLRVEPIFLAVRESLGPSHPDNERRGFQAVLESLRGALALHDTICFETTGASAYLPWLLSELAGVAIVLPVHVLVGPEQCLPRIRGRDGALHIPVSDDQIERINAIAHGVTLAWAAEIDNRGHFCAASITSTIQRILSREGHRA